MSYFNTLGLENPELNEKRVSAIDQDNKVFDYCKSMGIFSATRIWLTKNQITDRTTYKELKKLEKKTSVRRALNTLLNDDKIKHVLDDAGENLKVKSDCGNKEYLYELV